MLHQLLGVKKPVTGKGISSQVCKGLFPLAEVSKRGKLYGVIGSDYSR